MSTIIDFTCTVPECNSIPRTGSMCRSHEELVRKFGTPTPTYTCKECKEGYTYLGRHLGFSHVYCPSCYSLYLSYALRRNARTQEPETATSPFSKHSITVFVYHKIWLSQGGKCLLCSLEAKRLQIDHDRRCCAGEKSCGKCIRGLLCGHCNSMLGHYESCKGTLSIPLLEEYRVRRAKWDR